MRRRIKKSYQILLRLENQKEFYKILKCSKYLNFGFAYAYDVYVREAVRRVFL